MIYEIRISERLENGGSGLLETIHLRADNIENALAAGQRHIERTWPEMRARVSGVRETDLVFIEETA